MRYKISIIVPVYNVENYLARCIESILTQTYTNWELILIDDGSTDGSGGICDCYAEHHKKICVFHQTNQGVSVARNQGIEAATGDHLIFIDSDDQMVETMLEEMVTAFNGGELVVCGCARVRVDADGTEHRTDDYIWYDHSEAFASSDVYSVVLVKTGIMCNKMFRRDIVGDVRFIPKLRYGEDQVFIAQILKKVQSAVLIPKPLYIYYMNRPGNVVSAKVDDRSKELVNNSFIVYDEMKKEDQSSCGVYRIIVAINEVLSKLKNESGPTVREYTQFCSKQLRRVEYKDMLRFLRDRRFCSIKREIKILLLVYCPTLFGHFRTIL